MREFSPPVWPRITLGGGVERSRATDAASVIRGHCTGAGHSAWPNTHYVINAVGKFNAQRRHRIDPVKDCASQQLRQLPHVRRDPSRLVVGEQPGGGLSPRLVLERPSLTVPAEISTCAALLSI